MVELAAIEAASEDPSPWFSTSVFYRFPSGGFPSRAVDRKTTRYGSRISSWWRVTAARPCTCPARWRPVPGRRTPGQDGRYRL